MKPQTRLLALLVVALAALGLAGAACDGAGGTLTVEEYFERIGEIDAASSARADAIGEKFDEQLATIDDQDEAGQIDLFIESFDATFDEFEKLGNDLGDLNPPDEVEAAHDEAVEAIDGAVAAYRDLRDEFVTAEDFLEITAIFLGEGFDSAQQRAIDGCLALEELSVDLDNPVDLDCDE